MNKKSFLKPVPLLVATLLASGAAGSVANDAQAMSAAQVASNSAAQDLTLKPADDGGTTPLGHRSHSSHSSHSSHHSHYSGFMGQ